MGARGLVGAIEASAGQSYILLVVEGKGKRSHLLVEKDNVEGSTEVHGAILHRIF